MCLVCVDGERQNMAVQHVDIFHCLKCGELVYREHEASPPECCGEEMTRAVSHVPSEINDDETASWRDPGYSEDSGNPVGRRHYPAK